MNASVDFVITESVKNIIIHYLAKTVCQTLFLQTTNIMKFHSLMNDNNELNMNKLCAFNEIIMKTV